VLQRHGAVVRVGVWVLIVIGGAEVNTSCDHNAADGADAARQNEKNGTKEKRKIVPTTSFNISTRTIQFAIFSVGAADKSIRDTRKIHLEGFTGTEFCN
jgi:hypothetical protein